MTVNSNTTDYSSDSVLDRETVFEELRLFPGKKITIHINSDGIPAVYPPLLVYLFVCLEFIVPLENFSLIWRRHHCR